MLIELSTSVMMSGLMSGFLKKLKAGSSDGTFWECKDVHISVSRCEKSLRIV
jgi:hypothetical protein